MAFWADMVQVVGVSAALLAFVGFLARSLIQALFSRDLKTLEIRMKYDADRKLEEMKRQWSREAGAQLEMLKDQLQRQRDGLERQYEAGRGRNERLRTEILRWSNPILAAVTDLHARLANILKDQGHDALRQQPDTAPVRAGWSISYGYFMPSTLFLFAQYFYWVHRLKAEISFELFETQDEKDQFLAHVHAVGKALGDWPLTGFAHDVGDRQVFTLQQRGIAEAVTGRFGSRLFRRRE